MRQAQQRRPILYFPSAHNSLCLPPKILHRLMLRNALGNMHTSQEQFATIVYDKILGANGVNYV